MIFDTTWFSHKEATKNMNRLLSILVTLFILFLVYLWINHLTGKSDMPESPDENTGEIVPSDEDTNGADDTYQITDSKTGSVEESDEPAAVQDEPEEQPVAPSPKDEPKTAPVQSTPPVNEAPKTPPAVTNATEHSGGMHLVIAGNFLTRSNAEERVKQLKKLGYTHAEVVNFELSEYHTACAGRYSDLNEARRVARKIKELHGIDTYVRLGN